MSRFGWFEQLRDMYLFLRLCISALAFLRVCAGGGFFYLLEGLVGILWMRVALG